MAIDWTRQAQATLRRRNRYDLANITREVEAKITAMAERRSGDTPGEHQTEGAAVATVPGSKWKSFSLLDGRYHAVVDAADDNTRFTVVAVASAAPRSSKDVEDLISKEGLA